MRKEKKKKKRNYNHYEAIPIPDKGLASVLYFNGSDLAANRDGEMSEAQAAILNNHSNNYTFELILIVASIFITIVTLLASQTIGLITLFVSVAVVWPLVIWNKHEKNKRFTLDIEDGKVWFATGQVILEMHTPNGRMHSMRYLMTISSTTFELNKDVFLRFRHLDNYTVYFAPLSRVILSAEPVQPDSS